MVGSPLPRATLTWMATNGALTDAALETDHNGEGRAIFTATEPGDGAVEVIVNQVGYEQVLDQTTVAVVAATEARESSSNLTGNPVFYILLAIPAVLIAYLVFRFIPLGHLRQRG